MFGFSKKETQKKNVFLEDVENAKKEKRHHERLINWFDSSLRYSKF
jgi:hypothetical protein